MRTFTVPTPTITISPSAHIQGAMIGSPQDIHCIVNTVDGIQSSLVMISWMGPEGSTIAYNDRVHFEMDGIESKMNMQSGNLSQLEWVIGHNTYNSTLHFIYLMERDEGIYTCSVTILDTVKLQRTEIESLTSKELHCIKVVV